MKIDLLRKGGEVSLVLDGEALASLIVLSDAAGCGDFNRVFDEVPWEFMNELGMQFALEGFGEQHEE